MDKPRVGNGPWRQRNCLLRLSCLELVVLCRGLVLYRSIRGFVLHSRHKEDGTVFPGVHFVCDSCTGTGHNARRYFRVIMTAGPEAKLYRVCVYLIESVLESADVDLVGPPSSPRRCGSIHHKDVHTL